MRSFLTILFRAVLPALACVTPLAAAEPTRKAVVAYVPNWIDLRSFAKTIDYSKLTHINIAFENPRDDEGTLSIHENAKSIIAPAHAAGVKVLVSIGGGSASENESMRRRYFSLLTAARRERFIESLVGFVERHGFDGIDVDLEGPAINADYAGFIERLSAAMRAKGWLLTAALSQGYGGDKVPGTVLGQLDFVNIMAYDATGSWQPKKAGPHASLEFAKSSLEYWLGRGLPPEKAMLGTPFYGWGFGPDFRKEAYTYAEVLAAHRGAALSDSAGNTIWYNGIPTIRAKARLAIERGLAGIMIWSLDGDAPGEESLLKAIDSELRPK